jgi:hypothetical protein
MPVNLRYKRPQRPAVFGIPGVETKQGKAVKRCRSCHRVHAGTPGSGGCRLYILNKKVNGIPVRHWTTVSPKRRKELKDARAVGPVK